MAEPSWEGEKGGFDDFEFTIASSKFGSKFDVTGKAEHTSDMGLILGGDARLNDGSVHPTERFYKVGSFDVVDGGTRIVDEKGDESKMPWHTCGYMKLVSAARKCGAPIEERCNGNPLNVRNASIWTGLKFRFVSQEASFKNDAGETVTYPEVLPVEYLGEVSALNPDSNGEIPLETSVRLKELAVEHENQAAYLAAAAKLGADITEIDAAWKTVHA